MWVHIGDLNRRIQLTVLGSSNSDLSKHKTEIVLKNRSSNLSILCIPTNQYRLKLIFCK